MKKLLLFVLLFVSVVANAQKGISYQAVILDPAKIEIPGSDISGQPLSNGNVWVKFAIVSGTTLQFEEIQQTKTDAYGLVNLTIGSVASTAFNAITWDANQKSLQVYVSFNSGASYTKVSDQKLTYTPYALFAETAGKLGSTLGIAGGGTGATTAVGARANLGLGNVDNTADVDKPISTATKAALDLKANIADVNSALALKATVAALEAHMAITADTTMLATKAALTDLNNYAPINSPTFTGSVSGIDKSMVGLGSVDNTSDAAKPISTATQAALDLKAQLASPTLTGTPTAPTATPGTNTTQIATTAFTTAAIAVAIANASTGVADNSVTSVKIADGSIGTADVANGAITDAKITSVAGSKITGVIPVANGGTGQSTVSGILSTLGFASNNIAIGSQAGTPNQGVNANTVAIGGGAGNTNQGQSSVAIGYVSGYQNQGANSISIGGNAAQSGQGTQSVAIGFAAGQNGQGANAVAIGTFAGQSGQAANSIAISAAGTSSPLNPTNSGFYVNPVRSTTATSNLLYYNTSTKEITTGTGSFVDLTTNQTIAGVKTFNSNISVNGVAVGRGNGNNDESVAIGQGAMGSSNVNGKRNTAVGAGAMRSYNGTYWDNNTSIGYWNMPSLTSGNGNTSVGAESMLNLLTGTQNTSIGNQSLINVLGNNNVGVGKRAGQTITTGSQNTIIGTDADVSSAILSNATALGYGANVTASNTIQLGNSNVTNVKTSGTITAGAITYPKVAGSSGQVLTTDGSGTASWAALSGGSSQWTTSSSDIYFNSGNVGIGVSTPGNGFNTNLDLQGRASFRTNGANSGLVFDGYSPSGSLQVGRIYTDATSGTPSDFVLGTYPNGHLKQLYLKQSNGYVGVNNDNPSVQLDVSGAIKSSSSITAGTGTSSIEGSLVIGASTATGTSAALEVKSTTQGLLLPRLTTTQRDAISSPVEGLVVYNTSTGKFQGYATNASSMVYSNTNYNGGGSYMGLGNSDMGFSGYPMLAINDDGQSFSVPSTYSLNSVVIRFQSVNYTSNITLSVYSGSIGSGTLVGSVTNSVSSTGEKTFTFSSPLTLSAGNYYFQVHGSLTTNSGLNYSNSPYGSGSFFQTQQINGGNISYNSNPNQSLYFILNFSSPGWVDLN